MKDFWKVLLKMATPLLRAAGEAKKSEDENTTGKDDAIGQSLVYIADLSDAIILNKPLPTAPDVLRGAIK